MPKKQMVNDKTVLQVDTLKYKQNRHSPHESNLTAIHIGLVRAIRQ